MSIQQQVEDILNLRSNRSLNIANRVEKSMQATYFVAIAMIEC